MIKMVSIIWIKVLIFESSYFDQVITYEKQVWLKYLLFLK